MTSPVRTEAVAAGPSETAMLGPARVSRGRLEFLDALRGVAALSVAMQHSAELIWPQYLRWSVEVFRPGEFGVFLYFFCSGFIIPASLERYDDLRRFWISRIFRLFPLYWSCIAAILVLHLGLGLFPLPDRLGRGTLLANLTMVQYFTGRPLVMGASWTLAYEMCFYLACSLLFLAALHRRSVRVAFGLLSVALLGGFLVPGVAITGSAGGRRAVALAAAGAAAIAVAAPLIWRARDRGPRTWLAILAISGVMVPLVINRPEGFWFAMLLFGTMFTGTVLYRWHRGQVSGRIAAAVALAAGVAGVVGSYLYVPEEINLALASSHHTWRPESLTYAAAVAVFCGALALRGRAFPRPLIYLGTISYSVYLVHAIVIYVVPHLASKPLTFVLWVAVIIAVSSITYHFIEKPALDLGHRLARRVAPGRRAMPAPAPAGPEIVPAPVAEPRP
jgi:peptidoglycan/LPS O-acetylase OafA/YrhL